MVEKRTTKPDPIADAVQRSMPREGRPRLGTELEASLSDVEHRAAAQYASMEEFTRQLNDVADNLETETELTEDDLIEVDEATPEDVDFEDSLVHNITDVRTLLKGS